MILAGYRGPYRPGRPRFPTITEMTALRARGLYGGSSYLVVNDDRRRRGHRPTARDATNEIRRLREKLARELDALFTVEGGAE